MQGEKKKGGEILEEDFTFAYEKIFNGLYTWV